MSIQNHVETIRLGRPFAVGANRRNLEPQPAAGAGKACFEAACPSPEPTAFKHVFPSEQPSSRSRNRLQYYLR